MRIKVLPAELVDKIAAGEVIERPASVVKELVENSIDAGAKRIEVVIEGGGSKLIRISDDGSGMDPEDLDLSIIAHATSKLEDEASLERIASFGFRGEALSSICAISRTEITTRTADSEEGYLLRVEGGRVVDKSPKGAPIGTRFEVRDLFYNTPARLKFLKTERTENSHIISVVERLAFSHPGVGFTIKSNGKTVLDLPPAAESIHRASALFGAQSKDRLFPLEKSNGPYRVTGFVGAPDFLAPNSRSIYFYVNRRPIQDRVMQYALQSAYRGAIPQGSYPKAVIFLETPPELVDVNVHPSKLEVRFREENTVRSLIHHGAGEFLRSAAWMNADPDGYRDRISAALDRYGGRDRPSSTPVTYPPPRPAQPMMEFDRRQPLGPAGENAVDAGPRKFFSSMKIVGQLRDSYILAQEEYGLVIIDQHAAAERIAFNRLKQGYQSGAPASQGMLVPLTVDLPRKESAALVEFLPRLNELGIEVQHFGSETFVIKAAPPTLAEGELAEMLNDIAGELIDVGSSAKLEEKIDAVIMTAACHNSVRANRRLETEEMRKLLEDLDITETPGSCPHGRPVYKRITFDEIEKIFKRT